MAAITAATVAQIVHRYVLPYISNNWFKGSPTLQRFWANKKAVDGGARISGNASTTTAGRATSWDGGIAATTVSNRLPVQEYFFNWKYYKTYVAYEMQEQVKLSGSATAIKNWAQEKARLETEGFTDLIATDLFSTGVEADGTESTGITGLRAMCDDANPGASYNYGNLAVGTYTWWVALDVGKGTSTYGGDGTSWVPTRDKLDKIILAQAYSPTDRTNLLIADKASYRALKECFYTDGYVNYPNPTKPDLGFESFTVEGGIEILWDTYCPDNTIFGLNTKHCWLAVHPDFQMQLQPRVSMEPATYAGAEVAWMKLACNLVCDSRNRMFRITDVATS